MGEGLRALGISAVGLIGLEWVFARGPGYAFIFLALADIGRGFRELFAHEHLALQIAASLATALKGLAFGSAAGFALALLLSAVRPVDLLVSPLFNALRQIPIVALIPLIVLWFGNSEA